MPDLSDGVNWSEIDANNNNAAPNGWPEGMMPSGVNDAARADRGALKRFWDKLNPVQLVTPSGGVYTFTTASPAYPTAYVNGEIYAFRPTAGSVGNDQFQVNALPPKPILKRVGPGAGSFTPIIAQDIVAAVPAQVVYDAAQNTGAGAFILLNPFVPISGDGAGGVSVPGGLAVAGDLTLAGSVAAIGGMSITGDLLVIGYKSRSGTSGPYQTNLFNVQWTGSGGAHLWIDAADQGPIVCAPGGNIVVGGSVSAASLSVSGNINAATLSISGSISGGSMTASGTITGNSALNVTGSGTFGNGLIVNGGLGGAVAIRATSGAFQSDISGTALYLPNGNVVCNTIITSHDIYCGVDHTGYCGYGGNAWLSVNSYAYVTSVSDPAGKRDIAPVPSGCLDLVRAIEPQTFKYKDVPELGVHWGFMAPEIARAMDRAGHRFDAVRVQDNGLMSLEYNDLIAVLWAALRELAERLETT